MNNCKNQPIKVNEYQQKPITNMEESLKKEEVPFKDNTNILNVDKFAKIKTALRKSISLNITPDGGDDKTNEMRTKVLGYMKGHSSRIEATTQSVNSNHVRSLSKRYEDNLKNNKSSVEGRNAKACGAKSLTEIGKTPHPPRQYHSDINVSDKIPDVGGLRKYYRYMGYTDINNTVKVVSELKESINDKNKSLKS